MNGHSSHRRLTGLICAGLVVLCFIHEAWGGYAYLRVVGPPVLRFQEITTNYYIFDPKTFGLGSKLAETVSNAVNQLSTAATNNASEIPMPMTNSQPVVISTDNKAGNKINPLASYNFAFPGSTASDLLTVTPQMIAEYLKPEASGTNRFDHPGTVVFVPAEMPFLPPSTKGSAESRAVYESK